MKTFSLKASQVDKRWHLIDAEGVVLGRLAAHVANVLRGKHKPEYTPSMDCGDYVVIVNADKIHLTGKKRHQKTYYWHTGYAGGIKERSAKDFLDGNKPEHVIKKAVQRMIPRGTLGRTQMTHLFVYAGANHPHAAQKPTTVDFAALNPKNKRG